MKKQDKKQLPLSKSHFDYHLFKIPWCPLFGELPCYEYSASEGKLSSLILDARRILLVDGKESIKRDHSKYRPGDDSILNCYPEPAEVPFYPKDKLLLARDFYYEYDEHVYPFLKSLAIGFKCNIYDLSNEEIIDILYRFTIFKDMKSYELFTLIAIHEAWGALELHLIKGVHEKDSKITDSINQAEGCLNRARDELLTQIDDLKEDANIGRKRREQQRTFGKARQEEQRRDIESKRRRWVEDGNDLRKKRPHLKTRAIAMHLCKRYNYQDSQCQNLYKFLLKNLPK